MMAGRSRRTTVLATRTPKPRSVSIFRSVVRDGVDGCVKHDSGPRHNLRTTAGIDWQALAMGGGPVNSTYDTGTAASVTATTVTLPTSGAPGSTSVWNGRIIAMGGAWGVIVSNTNASPPVLTIDKWHSPTNPANTATTPSAGVYVIIPGNAPIQYLALTSDATTAVVGDTTLASELATSGFSRAYGTYAHTGGTATFTLSNTFTASGSATINKEGVFVASAGSGGGDVMPFESAEPSPPSLVSGDQLTQTVSITY
jgi:hypothetical protein